MENGPSNHNGEAEQVWERPWTLEEMQKSSTNWSLAADSGLFLFLQDFSQRMLSKTHEIEKQLDGLIQDTKATDSRLHTVFNDFLMLSNTQFIENRVYDEEVEDSAPKPETLEKQPEQEKTREQKEAELIPKVQEAVNYGLKVLESAFEQLDIKAGNSDSEDEETLEKVEPILEAKDLYVDRPLPFLIGSQAFMDQEDVGLGDLSSDEMSIGSGRDSVIESDVEEGDEQSDEYSDQDEEVHGNFKKKPSVASYDDADEENEDEDSDIFGGSDKDEDELKKDTGLPSFADELAARIKGETPNKPEADRTSLSSGPSITQKKSKTKKESKPQVEDDQDEMFKPPNMEDEEYSPFGGKGGLFSGGKGLFDDDDEGDLFSDAPKTEPMEKTVIQATEPPKTKKIPTGAVSIFPENKLFGSPNDSLESKGSKSPVKPKVQAAPKRASVGGGLFDDDDDDDDFFSGKTPNKSTPGQERQMPKKTVDLFGEAEEEEEEDDDDEGRAMLSAKASAVLPQQDKRAEGEEETRPPEKKPPVGAVSMFGPGTKNILEGLKKRRPSTSEESAMSEESEPPPEAVKSSPALGASEKTQSKGLFSDDEDSQLFTSETASKSKPTTQNKPNKAPLSIFDDEEEEDLFSSTPKSKSVQAKKTSLQPKKPVSSSLFSDDEDQWMSSKPSKENPEVKPSGMKSSVSAPSRLPSVKAPQKDGLFVDEDDLFAATNESSKKSSQRVSLLFEDEDDNEDKEPLFGFKTPENKAPSEAKVSGDPSLFESTEEENAPNVAKDKIAEEKKPVESIPPSEDSTEIKKKPVGAVSLFGGIDVLADKQDPSKKHTKNQEEIADGDELQKEGPPPMESKGSKAKKTALSLFDDDDDDDNDDEDMNTDEIIPAPKTSKSTEKNALKDHGPRMKSTGVFQDEELLFSHTQQRDNDPDVDLFATSPKPSVPSQSSVKPVVPTLFGDDEDDDLFSSAKPKAPPKVPDKPSKPKINEMDKSTLTSTKEPTSPLKSKKTSSRIGELQASLAVNPASLLPGAVPRIPGAVSVIPGLAPASLTAAAKPLPATDTIPDHQLSSEGGVSFESPAQVSTLQNANKDRAKGAVRRRPQTRAARHLAAQQSEEAVGESTSIQADEPVMAASLPTFKPVSVRPSVLTIPVSTPAPAKSPDEAVRPKRFLDSGDDLFDSDDLFATKPVPSSKHKAKTPEAGHKKASKTDAVIASKKDQASSVFDSHEDDLFATVKQKPVQKGKQMSFLEDDDDDIFGAGKSKSADSKNSKAEASSAKPDIFQDEVKEPPKAQKKPKEASLDASLFDVDIFADLTGATKLKEKKAKKKLETKSIFDDDMDDIFSTGTTKPTVKPSSKSKKNQPGQDPISAVETGSNIFDDPLNAFGGN